MQIRTNIRNGCTVALLLVVSVVGAFAGKKPKVQPSAAEKPTVVDSGSFGVYVSGKRMAKETFKIEQSASGSIAISEFTMEEGPKVIQKSELRMMPNGDLQKYSWKESAPGKGEASVEPSGEFLVEKVTPDPPEKPAEVALLSPLSTAVLEDYFFSHRELLIWRYMGQACGSTLKAGCTLPKTTYGVLVPRQRSMASVSIEYRGKEKVTIKGEDKSLDLFIINLEGDAWSVYMDENLRMVKIVIPADNTEVLRD